MSSSAREPDFPRRELLAMLKAGGVGVLPDDSTAEAGATEPGKYSPFSDPRGAERLATALARHAADYRPDVIVHWEDAEDAVLAHVVCRELALRSVRLWNDDGLVGHSEALPDAARVLLVTGVLSGGTPIRAIQSVAEQYGGSLVGIAALVDASGDAFSVPVARLLWLPSRNGDEGDR